MADDDPLPVTVGQMKAIIADLPDGFFVIVAVVNRKVIADDTDDTLYAPRHVAAMKDHALIIAIDGVKDALV